MAEKNNFRLGQKVLYSGKRTRNLQENSKGVIVKGKFNSRKTPLVRFDNISVYIPKVKLQLVDEVVDDIVNEIKNNINKSLNINNINIGDNVIYTKGSLSNIVGTVIELSGKSRIRLLIDLINTKREVFVDLLDIQRVYG